MSIVEVELKYAITVADLGVFRNHPLLRQYAFQTPEVYQLKNIYFDTSNFDLFKLGFILRILKSNKCAWQVLKTNAKPHENFIHRRCEWISELSEVKPDLSQCAKHIPVPESELNKIKKQLRALFETNVVRMAWHLKPQPEVEIECAIDFGKVYTEEKKTIISEIELELKKGTIKDLNQLAYEFSQTTSWTPEEKTKAHKGFMLLKNPPQALIF